MYGTETCVPWAKDAWYGCVQGFGFDKNLRLILGGKGGAWVGVAQDRTGAGDGWDHLTPDLTPPAHSICQELSIAPFRCGFGQDSVTFQLGGVGVECTGTWRVGFPPLSTPLTFSTDLGFAWLKGAGWGILTCWFDWQGQISQTLTGTLTGVVCRFGGLACHMANKLTCTRHGGWCQGGPHHERRTYALVMAGFGAKSTAARATKEPTSPWQLHFDKSCGPPPMFGVGPRGRLQVWGPCVGATSGPHTCDHGGGQACAPPLGHLHVG